MNDLVQREDRGRTRILHLHRPEVRNALNAALVSELKEALQQAADEDSVRAIVLHGHGKDFCAGADLKVLESIATAGHDENLEDSRHLAGLFRAIHTHPKPVIAAVHGNALAGGCGLACVCDSVFGAEGSHYGFTEARIGFVAAVVARFLIDRVGPARARDLLLSARRFDLDEALRIGLVDRACPADGVLEAATEHATSLAKNAGSSLKLSKQLLAKLPGMDLDEALEYAAQLNAQTRATDDCREGIRAFFEKRKPRWIADED